MKTPDILDHVLCEAETGPWPTDLESVLSPAMCDAARHEIRDWPGYAPTPLHGLDALADRL